MKILEESITYITELGKDYGEEIGKIKTLTELIDLTDDYEIVVGEATDLVKKWRVNDFQDFIKCRNIERRGKFSGEANAERFGPVLMPEPMITVSRMAFMYKVCWGLIFRRLLDTGIGKIVDERLELSLDLLVQPEVPNRKFIIQD